MPTREIKTRFKLEGEQAYKKAMTDAASAIKVLKSEQRLAAAEFEASGDAQEYAAEKARILAEEIEQQKKAVKAAQDAINQLTKNGVEPSSKQMQTWKTKLNDAKAALKKMETQLNDTEGEVKDQNSALSKARTAMSNAESKIKSLTAEEKLAEAQFKATGDKEAYAAEKTRILKEKVEAQKLAVAAAEEAIKSMTDNGVDPASAEMVEWKDKLVEAKTKLATMEGALQSAEKELKDQTGELGNAKTAMANAETKIKSLTAEEKLAEAQFKATGDKEAYAAEKTRILKEKIEAQKTAVAAAEKAIKSMTDNGVDPNAKEMVEWKDKLVDAKTKLANMETALDSMGTELGEETDAFGEATGGADSLKKSIDKVGEKVDYQNVIGAIDSLTSHIQKIATAAGRAATAVWKLGTDAGTWADDIATAAAQLDVDPETYQSWQYASNFIDTNVTDITKSWQDIQKKLKENNTEYLGQLAKLRVGVRNTNGTMRTSEEIFWDLIDALHNIKDPSEQARVATELFGNDWRTLKPLIDAGSEAYKGLAEEGREVAVVSNDNVEKLGKVDDAMQKLTSRANKLKNDALAALSPSFLNIADAGDKAVTALQEFLESAEGKEAIGELNAAIDGLIKAFLGEDNGKGTFKAIIDGAKDAVNGFTSALKWISENGETVKTIIAGLGIAWAGLKVSKGVLEFMTLLQALPIEKLTAVFSPKGAESVAKAAGKAAGGAAAKSVVTGGGAGPSIPSSFAETAMGLGGLGLMTYSWEKAIEARRGDQTKLIDTAEHLNAVAEADKELQAAFEKFVETQRAQKQGQDDYLLGKISEEEFNNIIDKANEASEAFHAMEESGKVLDAYNSWRTGNSINFEDWVLPKDWEQLGLDAGSGLAGGLDAGQEEVTEAGTALGQSAVDAAMAALDEHSPSKVMETIGGNAAVGLANGIYDRGDEAIRAAQWLADSVTNIVQSALEIHSPSRVFERLGAFTGEGFASGIEHSAEAVSRAVGTMIGATTRRPATSFAGVPVSLGGGSAGRAGGIAAGAAGTVHVTMVLDDEVLGDVMAPIVNDKIGAKINATRRS